MVTNYHENQKKNQNPTHCSFSLSFQSLLSLYLLSLPQKKIPSYLFITWNTVKHLLQVLNIQLKLHYICVILLDLNPVQYRIAVCRILIVWFSMIISDHFLLFPYLFNLQSILPFVCIFFNVVFVYMYMYTVYE